MSPEIEDPVEPVDPSSADPTESARAIRASLLGLALGLALAVLARRGSR